jgi:uncharacterized protein YndB with AHSA1/START domain
MSVLAESRTEVDAPASAVWSVLEDVAARPQWHPRLERAWLDGPLAPGTRGGLKPKGTRAVALEVEAVDPGRRLVLRGVHGLAVAAGHYEHELQPLGEDRCAVTIRMRVDGVAAPLVKRFAGRMVGAWAGPEPLAQLAELSRTRAAAGA